MIGFIAATNHRNYIMVNFKRYKPILGSSNLVSGNIKSGVKIFNVTGNMSEGSKMIGAYIRMSPYSDITIPRTTDLTSSVMAYHDEYVQYYAYTGGLWNHDGTRITTISSNTFTIRNNNAHETTLFYSYATNMVSTSVTIPINGSASLPSTADIANSILLCNNQIGGYVTTNFAHWEYTNTQRIMLTPSISSNLFTYTLTNNTNYNVTLYYNYSA